MHLSKPVRAEFVVLGMPEFAAILLAKLPKAEIRSVPQLALSSNGIEGSAQYAMSAHELRPNWVT
jgi:hypothetical protein